MHVRTLGTLQKYVGKNEVKFSPTQVNTLPITLPQGQNYLILVTFVNVFLTMLMCHLIKILTLVA